MMILKPATCKSFSSIFGSLCHSGAKFLSPKVSQIWLIRVFFFFFQAEDGIRDLIVTGVQTCALPICIDWDEAKWTESRYPTREDLDRVSTEHPVVARRIDCHLGSVNSRALESARDLVGLRGFEVDGSGRPTGILKEDAFSELHDRFASPPAVIERNLPRLARMARRLGITSIHDVVPISAWRAYQRAHRRGRFQLRVYAMVPGAATASLAQGGIQSGLGV